MCKRGLFAKAKWEQKKQKEIIGAPTEFDGYKLDGETISFLRYLWLNEWKMDCKEPPPRGFSRSRLATSRHVYIGCNFVVKKPKTADVKPSAACPTLNLKGGWRVQPVCEVLGNVDDEARRAKFIRIYNRMAENDEFSIDDHEWNVGILNNKLVQFDW